MVVENYIPSFAAWLLGPNWHDGFLFHWIVACVVALLVLGALGALVTVARFGHRWPARLIGYLVVTGSLGVLLIFGLLVWGSSLADNARPVEVDGARQYVDKLGDPIPATDAAVLTAYEGVVAGLSRLLGDEWYDGALYLWLAVVSLMVLATLLVGWIAAMLRRGPVAGAQSVDRTLSDIVVELMRISPFRVLALTWLAVKEAIRRRIVAAFAVFLVILLFAGWFLDPGSVNPSRLYLDFVLTTTSYLVLLLALFLSVFSLPADLRSKTLHTVVTKPVRSSEIVLGRMLGFTAFGTLLLAVMALISYVFVVRGLAHAHTLDPKAVEEARLVAGEDDPEFLVQTSKVHNHRHMVVIESDGTASLETENGHWHEIEARDDGSYAIGPQEGALVARVPVYGKLRFLDRQGRPDEKGINVGDEWTYRSNIEGATSCAAIWTFEGVTPERYPNGIPVEMTLAVFRTHKGDIEKGILGSLAVRNPETGLTKEVTLFTAKEFEIDNHFIPLEVKGASLFDDLVADGKTEIILKCLMPAQFFGVAQADLYIRARDAWFELNFLKGYAGIWLQMVLVIGLGVTFSTFLSGPVAMIATAGALVGGFFSGFMYRLATGQTYGGGPVESLIRLVTQMNVITELEASPRTTAAKMIDVLLSGPLWAMSKILPPFPEFSCSKYVAYGFDFSWQMMAANAFWALGFLIPVFVAGYLFLKTREVAR